MYQQGDFIMYGSTGVCRVEHIGPMAGAKDERDYYTLAPVFGSGLIYTPVDTGVFMRPILSPEQVQDLIRRLPELHTEDCRGTNLRTLTERYRAALDSHQCEDLLRLMIELYQRGLDSQKQGKRQGLTEIKYRKKAEELIHGEFSAALDIPLDQVPAYIAEQAALASAAVRP